MHTHNCVPNYFSSCVDVLLCQQCSNGYRAASVNAYEIIKLARIRMQTAAFESWQGLGRNRSEVNKRGLALGGSLRRHMIKVHELIKNRWHVSH